MFSLAILVSRCSTSPANKSSGLARSPPRGTGGIWGGSQQDGGKGPAASGAADSRVPPVPVSKPFVRPTAAVAPEGAAVALTCAVREGTEPLSFSWQHREPRGGPSVSPAGLGGSGAELRLTPANRSHAGWYACTVHNEVNNHTSEPTYLDIVCECSGAWTHLAEAGRGTAPRRGALGTGCGSILRAGDAAVATKHPATMVCPSLPWYVHGHREASVAIMVQPWPTGVMPPRPPCHVCGHHVPATRQSVSMATVHHGTSAATKHRATMVCPWPPCTLLLWHIHGHQAPCHHGASAATMACSQPPSRTLSKEASQPGFPPAGRRFGEGCVPSVGTSCWLRVSVSPQTVPMNRPSVWSPSPPSRGASQRASGRTWC